MKNKVQSMEKKYMRKLLKVVPALALASTLGAAGHVLADDGKGVIGILVHNQADAFMQSIVSGAEEQASALGYDVVSASSDEDSIKELESIRTFRKQGVTLLALASTTQAAGAASVDLAQSFGMKVVTIDSIQSDSKADSQVGGDDIAAGYNAAKSLAEAIGGSGKVAISKWPDPIPPSDNRVIGFMEAFGEYPDITVVAEDGTGHDTLEAMNWATAVLQKNPDIKGYISIEDTSGLGLVRAVENAGKQDQIKVASVGDSEAAMKEVQRGSMVSLFAMRPYNFGSIAVSVLDRMNNDRAMPYIIKSTGVLISAENVEENLAFAAAE